jgi:hypothetical protein
MTYEHRQPMARWISMLLGAIVVVEAVVAAFVYQISSAAAWVDAGGVVLVLALWLALRTLVTRVDANGVSWHFAFGWPGGHTPFTRISRIERTELNALEVGGAGMHWTIWHGWLWSVGGAEAVELFLSNGSRVTLGTDDPQGLFEAIERFRKGAA